MKKNRSSRTVIDLLIAGLALASGLGLFGRLHWLPDLFSHFRVQYMQLGLLLLAVTLWKRMHRQTILLIVVATFNYAFILPFYFNRPAPAKDGTIVRAMLINLLSGNGHAEPVIDHVEQMKPDVLLLEEVTPEWEEKLQPLSEALPYRLAVPRSDNFGIMLLSNRPLERGEILYLGPAQVPTISAEIHLRDGIVHVIGTHPLPPVGGDYARKRNIQLQELGKYVQTRDHQLVLMGDLNTTPWSPWFAALLGSSGLNNSMQGFGYQPTWPSGNPLLRIPIDHLLHSDGIVIHHRAIGHDVGSDHLPLTVDFSLQ